MAAGQQNSDDADCFLPQRVAPHLVSTIVCIKPTQPKGFANTCGERVYWSIYTSPASSTGLHFAMLGLAAKAYLSPLTQEICEHPRGMRILENGYLSCIVYGIAF